jgi:hypothetical protein
VNKCGHELGEGNVCVYVGKTTEETLHATNASAEECGVDDCEGELEKKSKATCDINNHKCNVVTDTEDNIGIFFKSDGNDVKVSLRDFGSYVKFNKECYCKGYKCGRVNTYLTAQLFAAPAEGQKWHRLRCIKKTGKFEKKKIEGEQLSILRSIRNEIEENWNNIHECKIQSWICVSRKSSEQKEDQKNKT